MRTFARLCTVFAASAVLLCASSCARPARQAGNAAAQSPVSALTLAPVRAVPAPKPSGMIAAIAPLGEADARAQVLVHFRSDLVTLEALEAPDAGAVLAHFTLEPALPGHFRFLTPRMVGFQADRAWPAATRVRVTVTKGLRDVAGDELAADVSWTFETKGIAITGLPGGSDDTGVRDLQPRIALQSNVALDRASLEAHALVRPHGDTLGGIALHVPADTATAAPSASPDPDSAFDPSNGVWRYTLVPASALAKGTTYDMLIGAGVLPRDGNRPSTHTFTGSFTTYDTLALDGVKFDLPGGRFTNGDPRLAFSTPIDEKSLGALTLAPAPPAGVRAFAVRDGGVAIATNLLAPDAAYTVTAGAELTDVFGQRLGSARIATFRTGDLRPDVWAPSGTNLFAPARDVRLNVVAVNAPADVRAVFLPLHAADVVQYPDPIGVPDNGDVLPARLDWPLFDARGRKNIERTIEVPLRAKLGGASGVLAYGVAAPTGDMANYVASGVVQLTNLGVFAQYFPDGGIVRVNRISDGMPVAGANVAVYPSQANAETKTPLAACAQATTGADGAARLGGATFAGCAARAASDTNEAPPLVTIVRLGDDWTYVRTESYSGAFSGDFYNGWLSNTPMSRGTIFSDRGLYKPGETAQLTGVGWFLADGVLRRGLAPSYELTLEAPDGTKRDVGRRSLDAFATFAFPLKLPANAPLGYYTLRATAGIGEELTGDFRVAEFKAANFKVDLTLDRDVAVRGGSVSAHAVNAYLFGAPLTGASTKYTVTRSPATFTPAGRDAFTFGPQWFWPDVAPDAATDVLETSVKVDAAGKNGIVVPVAADLPFPMTYEVDAETTDVANLAVADSRTFTALPSATLIGLRADDVGIAGTPLGIDVIATDPHGVALAGTHVHVELQAATYASATQIVEGAEEARESVTYATVASKDVTTGTAAVAIALTPPKPGGYRIRATLAGDANAASETDLAAYAGGAGDAQWFAPDPNTVPVKLDKTVYNPGDNAKVLVQSPFADADVHVAVVRHGVLWQTTLHATSPAPTANFTITPAMLPNAAVEAFVVRRGPPPQRADPNGANVLARVGFAGFNVALGGKYLGVSARAQNAVLAPGAAQTVHVHVEDSAHTPQRANVILIVANDAVLQLTGYRPPDLVKIVYADQPVATRYADNRTALVLKTLQKPHEKGFGYGGGFAADESDPRVRRAFSALAYYAGAVRTDAHGDATATFKLPDDLTTWRVMAVAADADGRFGNAESTFHTTEPLVVNPVLPQFARPGDRFDGGVALTNGSGARGNVAITAALAGPLAFLIDGKPAAQASLQTPLDLTTKAYRFPIVATGTGTATATFKARSAAAGDAFAVPVPVSATSVSESVVQTGSTTGTAAVPFAVAPGTPSDSGGLDVLMASSLVPDVVVAARDALAGDERLALSAASRLAVASDLVVLDERARTDAAPMRARAVQEIATLRGLQRAGGGFAAYWQATSPDAWDSLTALAALARARAAKIDDGGTLARAQAFASAVLADPAKFAPFCTADLCRAELRLHALDALDAAGDRRTTYLASIDTQRANLCFSDQVLLARLLLRAPGYADRATTLVAAIDGRVATSARGAIVNLPARYGWYATPVVAQSLVLGLALERDLPQDTLDALTRSLLSLRRNGSFGCACQTAAALDALVAVAAREPVADFTASAQLDGKTILSAAFRGAAATDRSANVVARDLAPGKSTLMLAKTGTGTLHYAVTYTYRIAGAAPGQLAGMRITRIVRAAGAPAVLTTFGLAAPAQPASLVAGGVYDIDLEIIADHPVERVSISDALPAGLEAVDTTFATTSRALGTPDASWAIGDRQIHADRIEAYADELGAGVYHLHYLARGVTPGTHAWPGADVHVIDALEDFGRSAEGIVDIK